jgi:uncharacterized repeat protein (TIGR01451 family)
MMLRCRILRAISCVLFATMPPYAVAENEVPVETKLIAEVLETVQTPEGKQIQRLVPADVIAQGQVVYYTVQIRNPTGQPARRVTVVQRIPANTTYVKNSASGPSAEISFSVDHGRTFGRAEELTVASPDGGARRARPEDYTHIRWQLRNVLAPGAVALVRFQAVFR